MSEMTIKADDDDYGDIFYFPENNTTPNDSSKEKTKIVPRLKDQNDKRLMHLYGLKSKIHTQINVIPQQFPRNIIHPSELTYD